MLMGELADDMSFAHAGGALDQQAGHAVTRRIVQQVRYPRQDELGSRIADPAVGPDEADAFGGGQGTPLRQAGARWPNSSLNTRPCC